MKNSIKVNDVVALLTDKPQLKLRAGQVGTVVEMLEDDALLVEFSNNQGETYAVETLVVADLLRLRFSPASAA